MKRGLCLVLSGLFLSSQTADAAQPRSNILPKPMLGLWGFDPADCADENSDGRLTVEARTVLFFATGYDITRVARRPDGSLRASGFVASEGEAGRERGSLILKLIGRDRLHVVTGSPEGHTYHRCPAKGRPFAN